MILCRAKNGFCFVTANNRLKIATFENGQYIEKKIDNDIFETAMNMWNPAEKEILIQTCDSKIGVLNLKTLVCQQIFSDITDTHLNMRTCTYDIDKTFIFLYNNEKVFFSNCMEQPFEISMNLSPHELINNILIYCQSMIVLTNLKTIIIKLHILRDRCIGIDAHTPAIIIDKIYVDVIYLKGYYFFVNTIKSLDIYNVADKKFENVHHNINVRSCLKIRDRIRFIFAQIFSSHEIRYLYVMSSYISL